MANVSTSGDTLEADAFKRLYPSQFYSRFIANSVRPDGRPLMRSSDISIGLNAVTTSASSALVKIGTTTALAGIKLEVMPTTEEAPKEGQLLISVEMSPMSGPDFRPGRSSEEGQVAAQQIQNTLRSSGAVDLEDLCINEGKACWAVYLIIYILDANGSVIDAATLAAVSALASLTLPGVSVKEGRVVSSAGSESDMEPLHQARRLQLRCLPLAYTCAVMDGKLVANPTAEEEALASAVITTCTDAEGRLLGLYKAGRRSESTRQQLQECLAAARLRFPEVAGILQESLAARDSE